MICFWCIRKLEDVLADGYGPHAILKAPREAVTVYSGYAMCAEHLNTKRGAEADHGYVGWLKGQEE